jgi:hypothetical protein
MRIGRGLEILVGKSPTKNQNNRTHKAKNPSYRAQHTSKNSALLLISLQKKHIFAPDVDNALLERVLVLGRALPCMPWSIGCSTPLPYTYPIPRLRCDGFR